MKQRYTFICMIAILFAMLGGCTSKQTTPVDQHKLHDDSLYRGLGGNAGITTLVEVFIDKLSTDMRVVHHWARSDINRFRDKTIEHLCEITGGPCEYTGSSMRLAHLHLDITEADFNAVTENLRDSMEQLQIPIYTQNRLFARLAPMREDIMGTDKVLKESEQQRILSQGEVR